MQKVLPVEFEAALWKGRQNYFCPKRLERALQHSAGAFHPPEMEELNRIREWSLQTREGTLSDFTVEPDPRSGPGLQRATHLHREDLRP